ncbi:HNH endonuclease signature motif containing protein [Xenorhabdus bovienii]|uniref:HNH endonuclease signature motif containing protein n=1 Tax=Xenorhabdus bovienii TaxID=40576 RepID=UPI00237D025A|nr:HNH endonuclease signature motif containing protein [Xenorhabdus bovienii]MDE1487883.1 HNH endonuclease [Xenorhabdus bovienii]MDE9463404.1 HNH endonuclease [Xenorhabdus bovienii]MDE9471035.1 HNH endonuclease [Xenorhabdus bovienii]MDE9478787.1 HNH endonuclease [Xenorhabdus bovienii]MDE9531583.1 HNH endonuclease [Xenorhabdus bovienii]
MSQIYNSKWSKARLAFLQQHPLCVMCHQQGRLTPATVVDHIVPHKLKDAINANNSEAIKTARRLFWGKANWQSLCASHHNSTKQRIEKRNREIGCDVNGIPIDDNSHWNK